MYKHSCACQSTYSIKSISTVLYLCIISYNHMLRHTIICIYVYIYIHIIYILEIICTASGVHLFLAHSILWWRLSIQYTGAPEHWGIPVLFSTFWFERKFDDKPLQTVRFLEFWKFSQDFKTNPNTSYIFISPTFLIEA